MQFFENFGEMISAKMTRRGEMMSTDFQNFRLRRHWVTIDVSQLNRPDKQARLDDVSQNEPARSDDVMQIPPPVNPGE